METDSNDHSRMEDGRVSPLDSGVSGREVEEGGSGLMRKELKALESLLDVGMRFDNLDQVYALYCDYSNLVGFNVKKGTQGYFRGSMILRMKAYYCCCEGPPQVESSSSQLPRHRKSSLRSQCNARLRVLRSSECDAWVVSVFNREHNHALLPPEYGYLLKSSRNLSVAHRSMMEVFHSSGIGVAKAFTFMEKEAKGVQNVGFTKRDAYNHMQRLKRRTSILDADADSLLSFLRQKTMDEHCFYWNYQKDDDGKLMNIFYRDARSREDYDCFGDVLLVDTTYKTNKYNLVCAPFVGLNHHRQNVMFGIGFLSEENTETFEWLFNAFLESMNGKEPTVVFSDQGKALMNGIERAFPSSAHRLCQWHICQIIQKRFGKMKKDSTFTDLWHNCMNGCETPADFETTWASMMQHKQQLDVKWFKKMYKLRSKWASVFTADTFTGGILATTRSELTNKVLKQACSHSSTLVEFVRSYEEVQKSWRQQEGELDAKAFVWVPGRFVPGCRLLTAASKVYSKTIFKMFESESGLSMMVSVKREPTDPTADNLEYIVYSGSCVAKERRVLVNRKEEEWSCSCKKWETEGLYCRHLFKVLLWLNIYHLPEKYILPRWRKDAKRRLTAPPLPAPQDSGLDARLDKMLFINGGMRSMYSLYVRCGEDPTKTALLRKRVHELFTELHEIDCAGVEEEEPDHPAEGDRLFDNPMKPTGGWVPGKRNKKDANKAKGKRKMLPKKQKPATTKRRRTAAPLETDSTHPCPSERTMTQWRQDFNVPQSTVAGDEGTCTQTAPSQTLMTDLRREFELPNTYTQDFNVRRTAAPLETDSTHPCPSERTMTQWRQDFNVPQSTVAGDEGTYTQTAPSQTLMTDLRREFELPNTCQKIVLDFASSEAYVEVQVECNVARGYSAITLYHSRDESND